MGIIGRGRGMAVLFFAAFAVLSSLAGASSAVELGGRPCFHACFDQCVPRDEFWFCQFSCYHRCAGRAAAAGAGRPGLGCCEQSCVRSVCGQLRPGSKMMAACRDTCRKSYVTTACRGSLTAV